MSDRIAVIATAGPAVAPRADLQRAEQSVRGRVHRQSADEHLKGRVETHGSGGRAVIGPASINLPERYRQPRVGPAVVGVRSEYVQVSTTPAPGAWRATVYTREPLGSDLYLTLDMEGALVRARVEAEMAVSDGDQLWMRFNETRLYFFDPETGRALAADAPARQSTVAGSPEAVEVAP